LGGAVELARSRNEVFRKLEIWEIYPRRSTKGKGVLVLFLIHSQLCENTDRIQLPFYEGIFSL